MTEHVEVLVPTEAVEAAVCERLGYSEIAHFRNEHLGDQAKKLAEERRVLQKAAPFIVAKAVEEEREARRLGTEVGNEAIGRLQDAVARAEKAERERNALADILFAAAGNLINSADPRKIAERLTAPDAVSARVKEIDEEDRETEKAEHERDEAEAQRDAAYKAEEIANRERDQVIERVRERIAEMVAEMDCPRNVLEGPHDATTAQGAWEQGMGHVQMLLDSLDQKDSSAEVAGSGVRTCPHGVDVGPLDDYGRSAAQLVTSSYCDICLLAWRLRTHDDYPTAADFELAEKQSLAEGSGDQNLPEGVRLFKPVLVPDRDIPHSDVARMKADPCGRYVEVVDLPKIIAQARQEEGERLREVFSTDGFFLAVLDVLDDGGATRERAQERTHRVLDIVRGTLDPAQEGSHQ